MVRQPLVHCSKSHGYLKLESSHIITPLQQWALRKCHHVRPRTEKLHRKYQQWKKCKNMSLYQAKTHIAFFIPLALYTTAWREPCGTMIFRHPLLLMTADSGEENVKERVPDEGCLHREVEARSFSGVMVMKIYFSCNNRRGFSPFGSRTLEPGGGGWGGACWQQADPRGVPGEGLHCIINLKVCKWML